MMSPEERDTRSAFEMSGFVEEDTGGNCKAWVMNLEGNRSVLVTNGDGGLILDMSEPCVLSFMVPEHGEPCKEMGFASANAFMAWLDRECGFDRGRGMVELTAFQVMERCYADFE